MLRRNMLRNARCWSLAVATVLSLFARTVQGDDNSRSADIASELDTRIRTVDVYLADLQRPTRAYYDAWLAGLGALTVGQAVMAPFEDDRAARAGLIVGATLSGAGAVLLAVTPHPGRWASRLYRSMPEGTEQEKRKKLASGEAWLRAEADSARRATGLGPHLAGLGVGLALGLGLGLGFDDNLWGALRSGIGAVVIAEARVWTRPTRAITYDARYRAAPLQTAELSLMPLIAPRASGLHLAGRF